VEANEETLAKQVAELEFDREARGLAIMDLMDKLGVKDYHLTFERRQSLLLKKRLSVHGF
jgi:hypothetical protein